MPYRFLALLSCCVAATLPCVAALPAPTTPADAVNGQPEAPRIPAAEFRSRAAGLVPDAAAPCTAALQSLIDSTAAAGGGHVILEPGVYVSGPLRLAAHIDLHLEKGATLRLLPLGPDFPSTGGRFLNFLSADKITDLRISGEGTIDGQGTAWWTAYRAKDLPSRRPQMIALTQCDRVELTGFTVLDPPNTHVSLRLCRQVSIHDITLQAPGDSPNTDGLNLSGRDFLIEHCRIATGDDNLVILTPSAPRDWQPPLCSRFTIRDCAFGTGHGLSIGSYTTGGISDVTVEHCTFDQTTAGIRMKASRDRGGLVEHLVYRDIAMRGVKYPIFISSYYPHEPKSPELDTTATTGPTTPQWRDILIENVNVTAARDSLILWGAPELPLDHITLRRIRIASESGAKIFNARELVFDHVAITPKKGQPYTLYRASGHGLAPASRK